MKLWNLYPIDCQSKPWSPWYDKAFGFVVRAETEHDARVLAEEESGDESENVPAWLSLRLTRCVELTPEGEDAVICRDFSSA